MRIVVLLALALAVRAGAYDVVPVPDGGTLAGRVRFEGTPPAPQVVEVTKDQRICGTTLESRDVRVGPDGGLRDVAVVVRATRGKPLVVPPEPVTFDQRGCQYHPFVLAFPVGTTIAVLNSDDTMHDVHVRGTANPDTNRAMPKYQKRITWTVTKAEWPIPVQCNAHRWMHAWWLAMDQPYYAVTGADGAFAIADLPPGDYTVDVWHPTLGRKTEAVTIRPQATTTVAWSMGAQP
jgi:plastocyanin